MKSKEHQSPAKFSENQNPRFQLSDPQGSHVWIQKRGSDDSRDSVLSLSWDLEHSLPGWSGITGLKSHSIAQTDCFGHGLQDLCRAGHEKQGDKERLVDQP